MATPYNIFTEVSHLQGHFNAFRRGSSNIDRYRKHLLAVLRDASAVATWSDASQMVRLWDLVDAMYWHDHYAQIAQEIPEPPELPGLVPRV